ncbi:MAG: hypothetical protein J6N76_08870 [Lachnospiraceae bacterium]|nr:hypothetical protein [Lachnospiraceae bacterium]
MKEQVIGVVRVLLILATAFFTFLLIFIIVSGISEYRQASSGDSSSWNTSADDIRYDIEHGDYNWMLRELKGSYRNALLGDKAAEFEKERPVAEYYQWSIIARSYFYAKDMEKAGIYAEKAAEAAALMGEYSDYRKDIDDTLGVIGD